MVRSGGENGEGQIAKKTSSMFDQNEHAGKKPHAHLALAEPTQRVSHPSGC